MVGNKILSKKCRIKLKRIKNKYSKINKIKKEIYKVDKNLERKGMQNRKMVKKVNGKNYKLKIRNKKIFLRNKI